jgi:hypothetical protein
MKSHGKRIVIAEEREDLKNKIIIIIVGGRIKIEDLGQEIVTVRETRETTEMINNDIKEIREDDGSSYDS